MTPCREWTGDRTRGGYGRRYVTIDGKRKQVLMHRWVAASIHGWDAIEGKVVMHACDNPACYRYDHLRIGTHQDNVTDKMLKGRHRGGRFPGESSPNAKLTEADVRVIRATPRGYGAIKRLAEQFDVDTSTIARVRSGKTWSTT